MGEGIDSSMSVILVQEPEPPEGEEALCWLVVATRQVETFAQALQCIQWYRWR